MTDLGGGWAVSWRMRVLTAESLGVRGLCIVVEGGDRKVLIDPGIALGYRRHGLKPHPIQVGVGRALRRKILREAIDATDIVFSHYHGDHVPLVNANPYQLSLEKALPLFRGRRLWGIDPAVLSGISAQRARDLAEVLPLRFVPFEGLRDGDLAFSSPVCHGECDGPGGKVLMTRVGNFLHASDVQLIEEDAVTSILETSPLVVLAGGPPLYLQAMGPENRRRARSNARRLTRAVECLVLDHHLLRSMEGLKWLESLDAESPNRVQCAAGFMGRKPRMLEARRKELYRRFPVPDGWHDHYEATFRHEADY
jgi:predicted metallo-beta-lactamase superfamily hydrolase